MPFKSEKQRKWMYANEPEMAKKWEKEEAIKGKLRNLIKQEIKSINEGFDKYYLSSLLDSRLKKKLEIAIKNLKGKVDAVGTDYIWFRMPSSNTDVLTALITKLDRNKNVWIGDKRKKNIWDRRQKINKLEATTTSAVPPHDTPMAFSKSTKNAMDWDDEDDEDEILGGQRNESMVAPFRRRNSRGLGRVMKESGILYKAGVKKYGKEGMAKILSAAGKKKSHAEIGAIKDKYEKDKKESFDELRTESPSGWWDEDVVNEAKARSGDYVKTVYGIGKIKKVRGSVAYVDLPDNKGRGFWPTDIRYLKPSGKKEKGKTLWTESIDELQTAPFSSSEARLHIDADIKKMSKELGKASHDIIKMMMDGVKRGRYTPMDIARGIKEGPAKRTHFGELTFIQQLWNKVREKFRRYSKDGKLS